MRHLALAAALALAGCADGAQNTGVQLSGDAAVVAGEALAPADVARLKQTCAAIYPDLVLATSTAAPAPIAGSAVYPRAFCDALIAGNAPVAKSSASWLPKVLSGLEATARVAGIALPYITAALGAL